MSLLGATGAPLDLHEGISTPERRERSAEGCDRWPDDLRLRAGDEMVKGRCKSTNQCAYCARLAAVENAEMLALDALHGVAPSVWAVLTTPSTEPDQRAYYSDRRKVQMALRRRFPEVEIAWILEFTTGYGKGARGARRPHWNALVKGVTPDELGDLHDVIARVWCPRQKADPGAQFVGAVGEMGGLMRYLALHFQKESQAPPKGWTGHRFTKTRAYLWAETPEAREQARASLRYKREVWKVERDLAEAGIDLDAEAVHELAMAALERLNAKAWELVRLTKLPATWGDDGRPATWTNEAFPVRQT